MGCGWVGSEGPGARVRWERASARAKGGRSAKADRRRMSRLCHSLDLLAVAVAMR